jgi:hypothetical protein
MASPDPPAAYGKTIFKGAIWATVGIERSKANEQRLVRAARREKARMGVSSGVVEIDAFIKPRHTPDFGRVGV